MFGYSIGSVQGLSKSWIVPFIFLSVLVPTLARKMEASYLVFRKDFLLDVERKRQFLDEYLGEMSPFSKKISI